MHPALTADGSSPLIMPMGHSLTHAVHFVHWLLVSGKKGIATSASKTERPGEEAYSCFALFECGMALTPVPAKR